MPLHQSTVNPFDLVDRTDELLLIPKNPTLMNDLGIWREDFLSTRTVTFEERNGHLFLLKDMIDGSKPQTTGNDVRKLHSYPMAHFPYVDALYPQDIAGISRPGGNNTQLDTEERALVVKLERYRKSVDRTLNFARFRTLAAGDIWAPNGTIAGNFYADFGLTRKTVSFALATPTTDIMGKCEEIIQSFHEQATEGQTIDRVTAYCSGGFFSALINHPKVQNAYNLYAAVAPQQISRDRAGGMALRRHFVFSNIEFIEVLDSVSGTPLVDVNTAVFIANDGDDSFVTAYGPPQRFGYINTTAESAYLWTRKKDDNTEITIEGQTNFINMLRRPGLVAGGTTA